MVTSLGCPWLNECLYTLHSCTTWYVHETFIQPTFWAPTILMQKANPLHFSTFIYYTVQKAKPLFFSVCFVLQSMQVTGQDDLADALIQT